MFNELYVSLIEFAGDIASWRKHLPNNERRYLPRGFLPGLLIKFIYSRISLLLLSF